MARKLRKKWVYRDNENNRLITEQVARQRDANTWTKEEFLILPHEEPPRESNEFVTNP